jgi:hypothetical protein
VGHDKPFSADSAMAVKSEGVERCLAAGSDVNGALASTIKAGSTLSCNLNDTCLSFIMFYA